MWPKLQNLITQSELNEVPETVRTKIEGNLVELDELVQSLKNENTELSAISERQQFQFEKEVFESQKQLKENSEECNKLRSQIAELDTNLNSINNQWRELQKSHDTAMFELQTIKRTNELIVEEKRRIYEQLERRKAEVEKLNEDTKSLITEVTATTEAKHAAIAKEEEAKLSMSTLQHHVGRLEREKNLLEQQVNDMHNELSQKNHEILTMRKEKSTMVLELQSKLEDCMDELHHLQEQNLTLKEERDEKEERIEAIAKKNQCLKESSQEMEEQYQLQIIAQNKLVELYKKASEDNQARVLELASAFEGAQKLLRDTTDSRNETESRAEAIESQYRVQIDKMENEINNLKTELKKANDLAEGKAFSSETLENFFPTAASTSKVMRSGMTLSQMYSEYVKAQEEIQSLKNENQRMDEQMKQIISEIEENTPVINKRMADYMKSLETITHLQTQLSDTLTNHRIIESEKSDLRRRCGQLERENNRRKTQITDLNRQIQTLLKEIEELKGGVVKYDTSSFVNEEVSSSEDINNADAIITKRLVTFRNIVDLQTKNQQLLTVIRDLSEKQEQQERKLIEERTVELQNELKNALSQVEDFRKERIKQTDMIQSIIRQRDMFRVLLTNQGFSDTLLGSPHTGSPGFNRSLLTAGDRGDSATKVAMNQLQSEFDNYKREKAENERLLNEKLEKMSKDFASAKIESTKFHSQLEYSEERLKLLQTNMDNYKKENTFLQEKNQKHTTLITQHQQTIHNLQQELMIVHETVARNTVMIDNLKAERDLLKGVEERLLHEKESLLREHRHTTEVLANLQAVQNNMERFESETKRNLKLQVEKYEKDTALLKMKIESVKDEYKAAVKVWEKQEKELQQKINIEVEKNHKLHEDLVDAYSKFHSVNQELSTAKQSAGVAKGDKIGSSAANETKSLKEQLIEAQAKLKGLQEQLDLTRKSSERYLAMCHDLEIRIKEQDDINKSLKDNMESSLKSSTEAKKNLEKSLEDVEKSNRCRIEEYMKVIQEKDSKLQELQLQATTLQNELISHKTVSETAAQTAVQAREDCLNQKKIMEETQEKYERELILHANDVQALTALKEEHQSCSMKIEELQSAVKHSEETLRNNEAAWNERELLIKSEYEALKKRLTEIEGQNENLHHQIELMSTQLAAFRSDDWEKLRGSGDGTTDGQDAQHLLQIIRFVKNEKEILNTQFDAAQLENVRLKLKVEQLTAELEDVKKELKDISDNHQVRAVSDAQHAELLRKVETLNLLTESNNLLRLEKATLTRAKEELEERITKLEKEIQPLGKKNKEFESENELLTVENSVLKNEVKSWQSRTNQLLEQSHRIGPQEYRNLTKELEELKVQKQKLTEELQRKQSESSQANVGVNALKKEIEMVKNELQQKTQEMQKKNEESIEHQKTMVQVKKIGRKYKTQYDELKVLYDDLLSNSQISETPSDSQIQELQKKLQDHEKMMKEYKEEMEKDLEKCKQEKESSQKEISAKEDRFKSLLSQLRQRYNNVNNTKDSLLKERTALVKEKEELKQELDDLKKQHDITKQDTDEENMRVVALKSQYENKIATLTRELKALKETVDYLEKQQDIRHKIGLQQKTTKAVPVSGIVERGGGGPEPLTANIKPLSSPSQPSGSSLRHATHTASPSPRSTPTASIRPMAIGSVASSGSPQTRMAAVHPTTASAIPTSVEEDAAIVIVSTASNVPHATVQPTPATATVAPSTVAVTITPSAHTPVISEVTTNTLVTASIDSQVEQPLSATEPAQNLLMPNVTYPATALVGPRIDTVVSSTESAVIETPAPTASVIVSPPATQTQMVTPTVKRARDDNSGSANESPDSASSVQKRVRMISEGSQTNQHASSSSNIAIVPAATVVTRNKEIPTSEVTPNVHVESVVPEPLPTVVTSTTTCSVFTEEEATREPVTSVAIVISPAEEPEKAAAIEEQEEQAIDWEEHDDSKAAPDFAVEGMEEEEEVGEHMEDFDDERASQDEDMVDDQDNEVVEMGEQQVEESIDVIDTLDNNSDNQMEADSSNLQAPSSDQCMAPPAFPVTQVPEATSVAEGIIGGQVSTSQSQRQFPVSQFMQMRQPSTSRQNLQPFMISGQGPGFEEGDDSIVPSTPTLFVPRRTDGFAEAVSSPHVSSGRFSFNSSESSPTQQSYSQLASQGALGVDDTRMDLSQFDEGGGRTVPSTPLQVSPPTEENIPEVPEIVNELTSGQSNDAAVPIPTIKIESSEGHDLTELEPDHQNISLHEITTRTDSEAAKVSTDPETKDKETSDAETSLVPTTVTSSDAESSKKESESSNPVSESPVQGTSTQNVRKPIVWEKQDSPASNTSSTPTLSSSSSSTPIGSSGFPSPAADSTRRSTRSRRMRYRGSAVPGYQQRETWHGNVSSTRRGRGRTRRSSMF